MSINSNMKAVTLQVKTKIEGKSGAVKEGWQDVDTIYVSIYKNSDNISTQSVRYNLSTHTGLTFYKNIKEGINRLVDSDGIIYNITGANGKSRLNRLLLKVVDVNV